MHFKPEIYPEDLLQLIPQFIDITGWKAWKRQFEWLETQEKTNFFFSSFLQQKFGREYAFEQILKHGEIWGVYPSLPESPEQFRMYSFIYAACLIHRRLGEAGKKRLVGMILDALKKDRGLAPVAFELKAATLLMGCDCDVIFNDMENGGGFDFLATHDNREIEVECKFVTPDIGRKIHRGAFHKLGGHIKPFMDDFMEMQNDGIFVLVKIPGRLTSQNKEQTEIASSIKEAVQRGTGEWQFGEYSVRVEKFDLKKSPFANHPDSINSENDIRLFVESALNVKNGNFLINGSPRKNAVVFSVASMKKDAVLDGIFRRLKDSAREQFSGARPKVIFCELSGITSEELMDLSKSEDDDSPFHRMITRLFSERSDIFAVVFMGIGEEFRRYNFFQEHSSAPSSGMQEEHPVHIFYNKSHPLTDDPSYKFIL